MLHNERMLFWHVVKTVKKPENLADKKALRDQYSCGDIQLIVTDSGFTNKLIASGVVAVDNGTSFELREGSAGKLQELVEQMDAIGV